MVSPPTAQSLSLSIPVQSPTTPLRCSTSISQHCNSPNNPICASSLLVYATLKQGWCGFRCCLTLFWILALLTNIPGLQPAGVECFLEYLASFDAFHLVHSFAFVFYHLVKPTPPLTHFLSLDGISCTVSDDYECSRCMLL